jgi:hypothetical protein
MSNLFVSVFLVALYRSGVGSSPAPNVVYLKSNIIVLFFISQVVGWENPKPTINWQQLGKHLPSVTLGRCSCHFR